ncbi:hypothetical protein [Paenirhodobacter sp.]|uniref:hypothetical protein n=1 Tax=Paenirhodobacter sp. TaxID=1965326 RepID=UPI003B5014C0
MTLSAQITMLAAEVASIEQRLAQSEIDAAEASAALRSARDAQAALQARMDAMIAADGGAREAAMWRGIYEASEQERMSLLGMIRGEQIP